MSKSVVDIIPRAIDADAMPVALLQVDRRRRVLAINADAENMLGLSRHLVCEKSLTEILYHDSPLFDLLDRVEETSARISAPAIRLKGPRFDVREQRITVSPMPAGGFSIVCLDSAQSDQSSSDAPELAAFGRILGHEVKNPLAGISGAAQLLNRKAREDQEELLELIMSESRRIERIVNDLSAFELFSSPRCQPCNVHEVLERVLRSEEAVYGGQIRFHRLFDPSLPSLNADADHLHEAFQNLVRNGAEAILSDKPVGEVKVLTRFEIDRRRRHVSGGPSTRSIKVEITDNGPGITPRDRDKIFNMFHSTKQTGSGLGLTVASQVIAAHDGAIELESEPGTTRFKVFLPIAGPL
ncbi:MAG: ATP-binding protein [Pseudomonadota bacterium]